MKWPIEKKHQLEKKAAYRQKNKEEVANARPEKDVEGKEEQTVLKNQISRQKESGRKSLSKDRAKAYRDLKKSQEENKKLKRKLEKYKKRLERSNKKQAEKLSGSPSPMKKVKQLLGPENVSPIVKNDFLWVLP